MAATRKAWQYRGGAKDVVLPSELLQATGNAPLLARLLWNRGITQASAAQELLTPLEKLSVPDPWQLPDMEPAIERITAAIRQGEPMLVYGDFDVDGLTGTAIFYETLKRLGAKVSFYIPNRASEGHGLNAAALCRLVSTRQLKLVITTDTGIANFKEVSLLAGLGVDTVITDHHELPENLPPAVANVNPQRFERKDHPLGQLSGAGVAYCVCRLLNQALLSAAEAETASLNLLDLVAVGLIADMVPLLDGNRTLVRLGLPVLEARRRLAFRLMLEKAGVDPDKPVTTETVGFTLGPRLNALGRLGDATEAVTLLTTDDPAVAEPLAQRLEGLNKRRQVLCDETFAQAQRFLETSGMATDRKAIVLGSPDWNPGIIGIVASRLVEAYHRPTFLFVLNEADNTARCSARSIPGVHVTRLLEQLNHYLLHYGGHAGAAGCALPLDKFNSFRDALWKLADQTIPDELLQPSLEVDCVLPFDRLSVALVDLLERLAPFGMGFPAPTFALEDLKIAHQKPLGDQGQHLKLMLTATGQPKPVEGFLWRYGANRRVETSQPVCVVATVEKNLYDPQSPAVRLTLQDLQRTGGQAVSEQEPEEPPARLSTLPIITVPGQSLAGSTSVQAPATEWVDHRQQGTGLDVAMAQLLAPFADRPGDALVYNEGRAPSIPLVTPQQVIGRLGARPCQVLVLWDLPPTPEALAQLLAATQPKQLHWAGGKYQSVPLQLAPTDFLKGLLAGAQKVAQTGQVFPLSVWSGRFATTDDVVLLGFNQLESQNRLTVRLLPAEPVAPQAEASVQVAVSLPNGSAASSTVRWDWPESGFYLFQQAIQTVSHYRQQLLQQPLDGIRQAVYAMLPAGSGSGSSASNRVMAASTSPAA